MGDIVCVPFRIALDYTKVRELYRRIQGADFADKDVVQSIMNEYAPVDDSMGVTVGYGTYRAKQIIEDCHLLRAGIRAEIVKDGFGLEVLCFKSPVDNPSIRDGVRDEEARLDRQQAELSAKRQSLSEWKK